MTYYFRIVYVYAKSFRPFSNDTAVKAAVAEFLFLSHFFFVHGTHSWFFIAFVGGVVYYTWYKKNVLDKVSARLG